MGTSLANYSWGGSDAAYQWALHLGVPGTNLTTTTAGLRVSAGNGADSGLKLWSGAIGVGTAADYHKIETQAQGARTLVLPNTSGTLLPATVKVLGTSQTNNSTSHEALPDLSYVGPNGLYQLSGCLILSVTNAASGVTLRYEGGTEIEKMHLIFTGPSSSRVSIASSNPSGDPADFVSTQSPDTSPYLVRVEGMFRVNGPQTSGMQLSFAMESGATTVTILKDSFVRYQWVAA